MQLSEYIVLNQITDKPVFAWWKKESIQKKDKIISKTAIKYWKKTHKYGMGIPYNVKEAIEIDKENGDKLS